MSTQTILAAPSTSRQFLRTTNMDDQAADKEERKREVSAKLSFIPFSPVIPPLFTSLPRARGWYLVSWEPPKLTRLRQYNRLAQREFRKWLKPRKATLYEEVSN